MSLDFTTFTVRSTLELVADEYDAEMADSQIFRQKSRSDRVRLQMGLKDASNVLQPITVLESGSIDEYNIHFSADDVTTSIRGRDAGFPALDTYVRRRYRRAPVPEDIATATPADTTPTFVGRFKASKIAEEVATVAGLNLSWEVRDYELLEDFEANGRCIDILRQLIEPWTLVEPYRADIFTSGTDVVIKQRNAVGITAPIDYTFTMNDARRTGLTVRVRPMQKVGLVTLRGAKTSTSKE